MDLTINLLSYSSPPGENVNHFAGNAFKCTVMNKNVCIAIQISLNFVPKGPIEKKSALIQVMAWQWTGLVPNRWQAIT